LSVLLAKIYVEPRPMPMDDGSCQSTFGFWHWFRSVELTTLFNIVIQKHILVLKNLKLSYPSLLKWLLIYCLQKF
jgi:hypothetical protein